MHGVSEPQPYFCVHHQTPLWPKGVARAHHQPLDCLLPAHSCCQLLLGFANDLLQQHHHPIQAFLAHSGIPSPRLSRSSIILGTFCITCGRPPPKNTRMTTHTHTQTVNTCRQTCTHAHTCIQTRAQTLLHLRAHTHTPTQTHTYTPKHTHTPNPEGEDGTGVHAPEVAQGQ